MGPFERFIGAVAAAIETIAAPVPTTPPADPPAEMRLVMPDSVPLPRPRPDLAAATTAAPAPATPEARAAVLTNPFVAGAPGAVAPAAAAQAPEPLANAGPVPPAPPATEALPAADAVAAATPVPTITATTADAATPGPPPDLAPAIPGVTMVTVHPADTVAPAQPGPLDLPGMLAMLGQAPDATPLGFAPANEPLAGPGGAIDALLRGGLDAAPPAGAFAAETAPLPRQNPLPEAERRIQVAALPGAGNFVTTPAAPRQRDNACLSQLASLSLVAAILPPVEDGACGIATPIDLTQIGGGRNAVALTPAATVDCHVAGALNTWMQEDVQAAAARLLGQPVTGLRVASSYACRGVNNDPTANLSEHAFGRAIDISAFRLADGTWLEVHPAPAQSPEGQFLAAIRTDACGTFKTVLGPGVANHDDHFHLDLAVRGRNGDALYCQ